jgi:hypothetical protein
MRQQLVAQQAATRSAQVRVLPVAAPRRQFSDAQRLGAAYEKILVVSLGKFYAKVALKLDINKMSCFEVARELEGYERELMAGA